MLAQLFTEARNTKGLQHQRQTSFHLAAENGRCRATTTLLAVRGTTHGLWLRDSFDDLPVHDAARRGHLEMLRLLFSFDVTQMDARGYLELQPLSCAATNGWNDVVRYMLPFSTAATDLLRAMFRAARYDEPAVVRIFLEHASVQAMIPTSLEAKAAFIREHTDCDSRTIDIMCEALGMSVEDMQEVSQEA